MFVAAKHTLNPSFLNPGHARAAKIPLPSPPEPTSQSPSQIRNRKSQTLAGDGLRPSSPAGAGLASGVSLAQFPQPKPRPRPPRAVGGLAADQPRDFLDNAGPPKSPARSVSASPACCARSASCSSMSIMAAAAGQQVCDAGAGRF